MNTRAARVLAVAVPLLVASGMACSSTESGQLPDVADEAGVLEMTLRLASGASLESVSYLITGPHGFVKAGAIEVAHSSTISARIAGIPAATGYSLTLSGMSTDGATSCAGSASFDVVVGQTASANVELTCHEPPRSGSVLVGSELNQCPVLDGIDANPANVIVGSSLSLAALAHDSDAGPAALTYLWSATGGTLSAPSSAKPMLTCTSTGTATVTVTVSDGDPAASCAASAHTTVTCSPDEVVTLPYPGLKLVKRTEQLTGPTRQVKANLVFVDLNAPEIRFKMTPQGENLPPDLFGTAGWPTPYPAFEVVRQRTVTFLEEAHGQVAINSHFFAPFPVPAGSNQGDFAYLIGLAASRGNVYSAFESPFQNYAIAPDSPAINIDRQNNAGVVHRDPAFADGKHVLENVTLYNALSGSAQIVAQGVKSLPQYKDASHPDALLTGNATYSNANSWYDLVNSRSAIGLTQDKRTLVLFTVDVRPSTGAARSQGMRVGEVADMLLQYGVWDALNLDGGGSTSMALQDPADNVRKVINVSSDPAPGRAQGSNLAVYSDGIPPVTTTVVSPAPNANGSYGPAVTVTLTATDLRRGMAGDLPGWVDAIHYSLSGAQVAEERLVPGQAVTVEITAPGVTTVTYFATDAAGNDESPRSLVVRSEPVAP